MTQQLDFFGPNARFFHFGLVVRCIEEACPGTQIYQDSGQKVQVAFADLYGALVEFISPLACESSPVHESLRKGIKLVHLCFEVPDLEVAVNACREYGFHRIANYAPATAFENRRITWVYHPVFGLFELLESGGRG